MSGWRGSSAAGADAATAGAAAVAARLRTGARRASHCMQRCPGCWSFAPQDTHLVGTDTGTSGARRSSAAGGATAGALAAAFRLGTGARRRASHRMQRCPACCSFAPQDAHLVRSDVGPSGSRRASAAGGATAGALAAAARLGAGARRRTSHCVQRCPACCSLAPQDAHLVGTDAGPSGACRASAAGAGGATARTSTAVVRLWAGARRRTSHCVQRCPACCSFVPQAAHLFGRAGVAGSLGAAWRGVAASSTAATAASGVVGGRRRRRRTEPRHRAQAENGVSPSSRVPHDVHCVIMTRPSHARSPASDSPRPAGLARRDHRRCPDMDGACFSS